MPVSKLLPGYSKADTNNLPYVDIFMVYEYFNSTSLLQPESSHDKTNRSTAPHYGDKAIGFVQVKREDSLVFVQCLIRPQTRVRSEDYTVTATIRDQDEDNAPRKILNVKCNKCSASTAVCKHMIAFVAWLNRRSDEDSPTSIECYWKKSALADIGGGIPFITAKTLGIPNRKTSPGENIKPCSELLEKVINKCRELDLKDCILFNQIEPQIHKMSMHYHVCTFVQTSRIPSYVQFMRYLKQKLQEAELLDIAKETINQSNCPIWRELRYGRITASKLHEMSRCNTPDGTLVKLVLGAKKVLDTKYMKRGRELEDPVLKIVERMKKIKIERTGLVLHGLYPLFGSSPDGITETHVIEVKCPGNDDTFKNYLDGNLKITEKYEVQVQLQMLMSNKSTGYFCVARPDFEKTKKVEIDEVQRNDEKIRMCMHNAARFWERYIFPHLIESATC